MRVRRETLFAYLLTQPESGVENRHPSGKPRHGFILSRVSIKSIRSGYDPLRLMQEYGLPVPAGEDDNEKIIVGMDSLGRP